MEGTISLAVRSGTAAIIKIISSQSMAKQRNTEEQRVEVHYDPLHVAVALPEYVDNLKDEGRVCCIIDRLLQYLESKGATEEVCRVYLRRIMHTYYKFDYKAHRRSLGLQGESKVREHILYFLLLTVPERLIQKAPILIFINSR